MPKRKKTESANDAVGPHDFAEADLGDARRESRLRKLAEALSNQPNAAFPVQLPSSAEQEALYRFLNSEFVEPEAIVAAHAERTALRAAEAGTVLAIHDTTEFSFTGESLREGMAWFGPGRQGFRGHFNLIAAADGSRRPLGVLGLHCWVRVAGKKLTRSERKKRDRQRTEDTEQESARWWKLVEQSEELVAGRASLIHVMDAEGDAYEVFSRLIEKDRHFVIRSGAKQRLVSPWLEGPLVELRQALARVPERYDVEVPISARKGSPRPHTHKVHRPRDARVARLQIGGIPLRVKRPERSPWLDRRAETIDLNVVYVKEVDAPADEDPVEWILFTTEPVRTRKQVSQIVDWYRARWLIEEFFKALKTGCSLERRQLESYEALRIALAIFLPIACQLLEVRDASRRHPDALATTVLSHSEVDILRACSGAKLGARPTLQECLLALAGWGGHIRANGPPGWITLARGMRRLHEALPVWLAARSAGARSDRC